jgi:hypothetical protein
MTDRAARIEDAVEAVGRGQPSRRTIGGVVPAQPRPWVRSIHLRTLREKA